MTACFAQQNTGSFTAMRGGRSSARNAAAYSVILFVMGIAAAVSFIISSVVSAPAVFAVLLGIIILLVLVIILRAQFDIPRG